MTRILILAAALALTGTATANAQSRPNWVANVATQANGSHTLGNPQAKVKLTEYVSYTCSHCAHFTRESDAALRLAYLMPGTVSMTVQHLVRDPIDMTVAMLANCGDPKLFFRRHNVLMGTQETWLGRATAMTPAQQERWKTGKVSARMQAIAGDLKLYDTMQSLGFTRVAIDRCLADQAMAQKLVAQTQEAVNSGVEGTPSFALNGELLAGTHDWKTLDTQLKARL